MRKRFLSLSRVTKGTAMSFTVSENVESRRCRMPFSLALAERIGRQHMTWALWAALVTGTTAMLPATLLAQDPTFPPGFDEPAVLSPKALGPLSRTITTSSSEAQAFFNQALQMMYAFTPTDAAKSFRQAWTLDPDCAMCYWGEAWAWGPYLNGGMSEDDAPRAYVAIRQAKKLAKDHANEVERDLIEAMATRYEKEHDRDRRRELDAVYADAMAELYAKYPDDMEVGTLYSESLMLLEPRRGRWDIEDSDVVRIHTTLEEVLERDITHPGACHLYIHATESTIKPGKAEACADYLGDAIPGASHINHMPSHVYNRIGRWGDAVRGNLQAWHSDMKSEIGEGFAIYPSHNLHMLLFAASMDGQGAVAIQAGHDYGKVVPGGQFYKVMTMVRFGRFEEILELEEAPEQPIFRGFWDFGRGYAYLRTGDVTRARYYLESVQRIGELTPEDEGFRGHSAENLMGVVASILEGEILRSEGDLEGAISVLEAGVVHEDALRYDEPEPLNFSIRHWLGDALLEAERYEDAEAVFNEALVDHPKNGWSLFGLEVALRKQGKDAEADRTAAALQEAWARSDTWLRGAIF